MSTCRIIVFLSGGMISVNLTDGRFIYGEKHFRVSHTALKYIDSLLSSGNYMDENTASFVEKMRGEK